MNKKFSTLMAAALLAGSFPVAAQKVYVPVTPEQLIDGADYVIHSADHKSIMVNGESSGSNMQAGYTAPVLLTTPSSDVDTVWVLKKQDAGFSLTPLTNEGKTDNVFSVYVSQDGLYTAADYPEYRANFSLGEDSVLTVDGKYVRNVGKGGFKLYESTRYATKFVFLMGKNIPTGADNITEALPTETTATALYVIVDGEYVGAKASETTTKAINEEKLRSVADLNAEDVDKSLFTWIYDGKTLQNFGDKSVYLTVDENGVVTTVSDIANAEISFNGAVLNANGNIANVALANSGESIPYYKATFTPVSEGTSIVLYKDGLAYSADQQLVSYIPTNSAKTVWTLQPKETTQGQYVVRLVNAEYTKLTENECLVLDDGTWVTVNNVKYNPVTGKIEFPSDGQVTLMAGGEYLYIDTEGKLVTTPNINQANTFGLGQIGSGFITAPELLRRYGDHFTLGISYKDQYENKIDVTGIFKGNLIPCSVWYSSGTASYDKVYYSNFMLVNEDGNIIGVDTDKPLHTGSYEYGYALTTITPKEYALDPSRYNVWFRMSFTAGQDEEDVTSIDKIYLGSYEIGLQKDSKDDVLVAAYNWDLRTDIKLIIDLNAGSVVDATKWLTKPVYYTVESINKKDSKGNYYGNWGGKVLGLNEYGDIAFISPENVDLNEPEGQFAITYTGSEYTFANRENKDAYADNVSLDASRLYKIDETTFAYVNGWTTPDTLSIKPVSNYSSEDGFHRISPTDLNAKTYTISMRLLNGDSLNIIENHNDKHRIGLDEENATEWRIEMPTVKLMDATWDFLRYAADTVKVVTPINYYVDGAFHDTQIIDPKDKYYYPNTELQICTYILKNTDNGEYLYGKNNSESVGNSYYVCEPENTNNVQFATRIAFKENGEGTYNLVPVSTWTSGNSAYEPYNFNGKLSGYKIQGGASGDVLKDADLYEATANDLFVINVAEAPTYKKMEQGDKIILSLKNNTENVLVEGPVGGFATISNREAHKDLNPTLYVDTAYVNRAGNYVYQYLLGVRTNHVEKLYDCSNPDHGYHVEDTTYGYFLVNMIDSAKACTDVHNNKFVYNDDYKLDFVKGYHTNDTLFFTNDADEVISSMKIGDASYNMAKFAFKMIDEEANEFVIETGKGYDKQTVNKGSTSTTVTNEVTTPSYLRWVNGNLVVTDNIEDAAHFTMETSDKEATANEAISAGNVVVAGVDGAVVVKGAEGKNVIVSTILGKVVANEVVSSDNATIAAPAGIVVVSVDGESFKVVVK